MQLNLFSRPRPVSQSMILDELQRIAQGLTNRGPAPTNTLISGEGFPRLLVTVVCRDGRDPSLRAHPYTQDDRTGAERAVRG